MFMGKVINSYVAQDQHTFPCALGSINPSECFPEMSPVLAINHSNSEPFQLLWSYGIVERAGAPNLTSGRMAESCQGLRLCSL